MDSGTENAGFLICLHLLYVVILLPNNLLFSPKNASFAEKLCDMRLKGNVTAKYDNPDEHYSGRTSSFFKTYNKMR